MAAFASLPMQFAQRRPSWEGVLMINSFAGCRLRFSILCWEHAGQPGLL